MSALENRGNWDAVCVWRGTVALRAQPNRRAPGPFVSPATDGLKAPPLAAAVPISFSSPLELPAQSWVTVSHYGAHSHTVADGSRSERGVSNPALCK